VSEKFLDAMSKKIRKAFFSGISANALVEGEAGGSKIFLDT
jgi:hypothetical protein